MASHYEVLGLASSATSADVERVFKLLARQYHPDVSSEPDALEKMQMINAAYHVLRDDRLRREYDRQLSSAPLAAPLRYPADVSSIEAQFFRLWQQCYPLISLEPQAPVQAGGQQIVVDFVYPPYQTVIALGELPEHAVEILESAGWQIIMYPMSEVYLDLEQKVHEVYRELAQVAYAQANPQAFNRKQQEIDELEHLYEHLIRPASDMSAAFDNSTPMELFLHKLQAWWQRRSKKEDSQAK